MDEPEVQRALGRVVAALPGGGEVRDGQERMALAVAAAIESGRHLVVQAGTGTGKSLAYLVPALLSGRRVVVATATKALQDQLAGKDLPFLREHLGAPFEFAVLKGRANYLCLQRAFEVAGGGDQLTIDDDDDDDGGHGRSDPSSLSGQVRRLLEWAASSETGDRAELGFEPSPRAWGQVSVTAMECPGAARCPKGEVCFAERARQRAESADIVVVNTHLYGTHLASGGHVLPDHDVVVFDEAHELEDVASSSLGLELGSGRFRALARSARPVVDGAERGALDDLEGVGVRWEAALAGLEGKRLPPGLGDAITDVITLAQERAARAVAAIRASKGDEARRGRALQAGGHLTGDLQFVASLSEGFVAWVEGPGHSPVLRCAPIDVGALLAERLWGTTTAVLTSATIPPLLPARLGIPADEVDELDVGSPFDYEHQSLLYCAVRLPDPRDPAYETAMHDELEALISAAGGRTLALFTSWRAMTAAAQALAPRLPWTVLTQSDLPKPALVEAFTSEETACLFATMGFWQGVDVPGPSLSLVTIDRIPFPRPDEPLLQARRDRAGSGAFRTIDLPRAATMLAQGAGRLIRSTSDRGVVAVLDPRLAKAGYRWDLVRAVPPMHRTRHLDEVRAFLAPLHAASAS
ncbi:MAG TPA: ATP-dependent DNA helicase [Acidimicrobiales bacterium]|nr:ATP-dependent DNA helicase [Acidimicrobiales bacterium]